LVKKTQPCSENPFSSTIRAEGRPADETDATTMALGS
jgi:hypothetical protein